MLDQLLPFVTGCVTLVAMWLSGSKRSAGWAVGLANQGLWVWFIVSFEAWGLLPLTVALTFVYARNLLRWRADERQPDDEPLVKGQPPKRSEGTRDFSEQGYFLATPEGPTGITLGPEQDAPPPPP